MGWVEKAWNGIWLLIDQIIYNVMSWVYQVFYMLTEVNLFDYNNAAGKLTERIYVIFGVVMLFVFAYNILLMIANPDKMSDKNSNTTKLIRDTVISLVLVALLPTIFEALYSVQSRVLETNIIGNVILGGTSSNGKLVKDSRDVLKNAGARVSTTIFGAFYHPMDDNGEYSSADCYANDSVHSLCPTYINAIENANNNGNPSILMTDAELKNGVEKGTMKYMYIISTACGVLAVYLFASFALDVGLRAVKLAVLQVVAPVPIMLRITKPTGGIFSRWYKEIKETYLSLFVRLAIIYFAIFTIDLVIDSFTAGSLFKEYGVSIISILAELVLILSILAFAKEAPKLLKNLLGSDGGGIEWNIKKKLNSDTYEYGRRAMGGVGTVGANLGKFAFNGLTGKAPTGGLRTLPRNIISGFKYGWKNSGGNIENLRSNVRSSMAQTEKEVERARSRNARIQETRERLMSNPENPIGGAIAELPGIGRLFARGVTKFNDINDAIKAEGNVLDYLSNRINFTTSGIGAEAAGKFRKDHANIIDSGLIQSGIKNINEQAMREEEHTREYYNTRNMPIKEQIANLKSSDTYASYLSEKDKIQADRQKVFSSKEYADFDAERKKIDAKAEALKGHAEYSTYNTDKAKIETDIATYQKQYESKLKTYNTELAAIQKENAIIASDTTLSAADKNLAIQQLNQRWSANEQLKTTLDVDKAKFDLDIQTRQKALAGSKVGAEFAKIDAERDALKNNSAVWQELEQINARETLNESSAIRINEDISKLEAQRDANLGLMKQEIKAAEEQKTKDIRNQYMKNLNDNAKDIHAYYVNNLKAIQESFKDIPVSAQRVIFESAGFKNTNDPSFNFNKALNDIGNIFLKENYDEKDTDMLMGFFKGLKKVENRGPFDYRLSRLQDATSGKKDGDKK